MSQLQRTYKAPNLTKGFPGGAAVKPMREAQEMLAWSLSQEETLEWKMTTHSSILALENPWTERRLVGYSPWGHEESNMTEREHRAQQN